MRRPEDMWREPAGRGFIMLAVMSACFGFSLNAQQSLITNYCDEVLHFTGPQFGYMTAIREIPGFLLIFFTALFYRVSLQHLTAGALVLMAVGVGLMGFSHDFLSVVPWLIIASAGYHTVMQTQYALGLSLTSEARSGGILGQMAGIGQGGAVAALTVVMLLFHFEVVSFRPTFVMLGLVALVGAVAIVRFPHLHEGELRHVAPKRDRFVWRREYRYFYALNLLDGARQQVFFAFGLWVLVDRFGLGVAQVSALLIAVTFVSMISAAWVGRRIDRHGERKTLSLINLGYVVALGGYAATDSVVVACLCYVLYSFIMPISPIGAATYLRKIAPPREVAPGLALGVTLMHATAIAVPVAAGFTLNYVGYQVPFFIACGFALVTFVVTLRLDPTAQRALERAGAAEGGPLPVHGESEGLVVHSDVGEAEAAVWLVDDRE